MINFEMERNRRRRLQREQLTLTKMQKSSTSTNGDETTMSFTSFELFEQKQFT